MNMHRISIAVIVPLIGVVSSLAQSDAALQHLLARYSTAEIESMQTQAHHRYVGELLFFSHSFLIEENGLSRLATEEEIMAIDIHAYDGLRLEDARVGVNDPVLDEHVILLSRSEFEGLLLDRLDPQDHTAYLEYKSLVERRPDTKTR